MRCSRVLFRSQAREELRAGTAALADAVRVTLGPKSKSVLIRRKWRARILRQAAEKAGGDCIATGNHATEIPEPASRDAAVLGGCAHGAGSQID